MLPLVSTRWGARVTGAGTPSITIEGVAKLHGARHNRAAGPDRGRHLCDGGGDDRRRRAARRRAPELLQSALDVLREAGAEISINNEGIRVARNGRASGRSWCRRAVPGFPTDLQAQLMALMASAGVLRASPKPSSRIASCTCRAGAVRRKNFARRRNPPLSTARQNCAARP